MRYISAPWCGLLTDDTWLKNARHANACAERLEHGFRGIDGVSLRYPRQANGVFVDLPETTQAALREKGWKFYNFIGGCSRLMCSWSTSEEQVDRFLRDVREFAG